MDIAKIVGPMLLGLMASCGLYGVLCVQAYAYHTAFPQDLLACKILVYSVFALETILTITIMVDGVDAFVVHLGNAASLDSVRMYWLSGPVLGGVVAALGQFFFAYRLWILSKSWVLTFSVLSLAMCAVGAAIASGTLVFSTKSLVGSLFVDCSVTFAVWHWASVVCDVLIAVFLVYYLTRHQMAPNSRLHRHITSLIRLVIETGTLTASTNIFCFVLYTRFKQTTYFTVPYVMIPKLYSNTMLLILNNRIVHQADPRNNTSSWSSDILRTPQLRTHDSSLGDPVSGMGGEGTRVAVCDVWKDGVLAGPDLLDVQVGAPRWIDPVDLDGLGGDHEKKPWPVAMDMPVRAHL